MLHLEDCKRKTDSLGKGMSYDLLNKAGILPLHIAAFTSKIGLFQTRFSFRKKYFLEISNRHVTLWVLHLEDCKRKTDSLGKGMSYDLLNKAGILPLHIAHLRQKSDSFKLDFYLEKNIFWKFQIDMSHCGCFILMIVKGKRIISRRE